MITKKFRLGADEKVVNKCIPGLIESWEVQLGSSYEKLKLKDDEWFSLSQKINGNRASYTIFPSNKNFKHSLNNSLLLFAIIIAFFSLRLLVC